MCNSPKTQKSEFWYTQDCKPRIYICISIYIYICTPFWYNDESHNRPVPPSSTLRSKIQTDICSLMLFTANPSWSFVAQSITILAGGTCLCVTSLPKQHPLGWAMQGLQGLHPNGISDTPHCPLVLLYDWIQVAKEAFPRQLQWQS